MVRGRCDAGSGGGTLGQVRLAIDLQRAQPLDAGSHPAAIPARMIRSTTRGSTASCRPNARWYSRNSSRPAKWA